MANMILGWGQVLMKRHGKQRMSMENDLILKSIGYSTGGYYFYNPCDDALSRYHISTTV